MPSSYFCKNNNLDLKNFKRKTSRIRSQWNQHFGTIQSFPVAEDFLKSKKNMSPYRERTLLMKGESKEQRSLSQMREITD